VSQISKNQGDVYRWNVHTNRAERVERADEHVAGFGTDLTGALRARLRTHQDDTGAYVATEFRNAATGGWEEHFRSYAKDRNVTEVVGFSSDPNIAYLVSNVGQDKSILYEYDIAKRTKVDVLFQHKFSTQPGSPRSARKGRISANSSRSITPARAR